MLNNFNCSLTVAFCGTATVMLINVDHWWTKANECVALSPSSSTLPHYLCLPLSLVEHALSHCKCDKDIGYAIEMRKRNLTACCMASTTSTTIAITRAVVAGQKESMLHELRRLQVTTECINACWGYSQLGNIKLHSKGNYLCVCGNGRLCVCVWVVVEVSWPNNDQ